MRKTCKKNHCFWCSTTGFTLIELVMTIAIIAIIAIGVFVAVDPARRIGESRDAQRWSDIVAIAKAVELYTADNGQLPDDFNVSSIDVGEKVVLCSSSATLSCDGQSEACLVVNDADFLGPYLGSLPIDPGKSAVTDTGYYVTRGSSGSLSFGVCSAYASTGIAMDAQVSLPSFSSVCGDGDTDTGETCDDGNTTTEQCGNGTVENGTYCNASCTSEYSLNETCDYIGWSNDCYTPDGWYTESISGGSYCKNDCSARTFNCLPPP